MSIRAGTILTCMLTVLMTLVTIAASVEAHRRDREVQVATSEALASDRARQDLVEATRRLSADLADHSWQPSARATMTPAVAQDFRSELAGVERREARLRGTPALSAAVRSYGRSVRSLIDAVSGGHADADARFAAFRVQARALADANVDAMMAFERANTARQAALRRDLDAWHTALIALASLTAVLQLLLFSWVARYLVQPVGRIAASLREGAPAAPDIDRYAERADEIGALARATTAFRRLADERVEALAALKIAAREDSLTGLLNRQAFDSELERALQQAADGEEVALFCLDLDRFKDINDTHGHASGDEMLRRVAGVLRAVGDGTIVGRLGGDEFALVQRAPTQPASARDLAARLLGAFSDAGVGVSIGVALFPQDADEEMRLRHYADLALYRAKNEGRGRARFFGSGRKRVDSGSTGYVPLPSELAAAINGGELELHYQPKMRARGGKIDGLEALSRWPHPVRGLVAPDAFIPIAEKMGQIRGLTEWAIERAVDDQRALAAAGHELPIHVNLSACLLGDPSFARTALNLVANRAGVIGFEITETAVIDDPKHALGNLQEFVEAGLRISIDDYGAGMSSLAYLKRLPAHELKIDRAFVAELSRSHRDPLIVRSTIDLAHALGMEVTAEGVEKLSSFALLRAMGCDLIQGFLVAKPMPMPNLLGFLSDSNALQHLERITIDGRAGQSW